jgi:beta-glucosidase
MRYVPIALALVLLNPGTFEAQQSIPAYQNLELSFEERALDLVGRMTLEEKVSQLLHDAKAIDRLGIPAYNWMNECLHGVAVAEGYATVFPQAIGMGASFNTDLMLKVGTAISDEARAMHHGGVRNVEEGYVIGLTFWSPNINLFRDPRWGRGQETYGEDPYHMGQMAIPFIKGLQGEHPRYLKTVSTVKHYVVHSGPEEQRHEFNTLSNERDFWESYMPHYIAAIKDADVQSVMCAYSRLNGESCCGSDYLLNELLRERLGFEGYIVSDCGSVTDIYDGHHLTKSVTEAAALALKSGVDLNCGRAMTFPYAMLVDAVAQGMVDEAVVDSATYRLLLARFKLGMFDPPEMVPYAQIPVDGIDSDEHKDLALQMARESMVLLKNENNLLPLSKQIGKVAVIGPNADDHRVLYGNYNGIPSKPVSVLEGIEEKLPEAEVVYAKGSELIDNKEFGTQVPSTFLFTPDMEAGLLASYYPNRNLSGEPSHTRIENEIILFDEFGPPYDDLDIDKFSVRWEGYISFPETALYRLYAYAFPHYKIYIDDKLIGTRKRSARFRQYEAAKLYKIRVELISDTDGFYFILAHAADNSSLRRNAVETARKSDTVVLVVGLSSLLEEEGQDRSDIELPEIQQNLIKEVLATGKPTILILMTGGAVALDAEALQVPVILEAWYPGQSGGAAVADVLFGDYNPGGKLPVTFYQSTTQLPDYEDYSMENRTYKYFTDVPLYPFGHGLSYTSFTYKQLQLQDSITAGEVLELSVEVENTGKVAGDEVVQVYVKDVEASVRVPVHALQDFRRVHLQPDEKQTVNFTLTPQQLALLTDNMEWKVEPGEFIISVGGGQPGAHPLSTEVMMKSIHVTGDPVVVQKY